MTLRGRTFTNATDTGKLCSVNSTSCKKGYNSYWKVSNKSLSMEFVVKFFYLMLDASFDARFSCYIKGILMLMNCLCTVPQYMSRRLQCVDYERGKNIIKFFRNPLALVDKNACKSLV